MLLGPPGPQIPAEVRRRPLEPGSIRTGRRCEHPGNRPHAWEETSMAASSRGALGRRLGVLVALNDRGQLVGVYEHNESAP